jgi:hypothetical protein
VIKAANAFKDKTSAPNQLWQTGFTYLKVIGWGWFYLSTVLDDFSRYIVAWKLCASMRAQELEEQRKPQPVQTPYAIGSHRLATYDAQGPQTDGEGTFAGVRGNDGVAPKAVLPVDPRRPAAGMDLTMGPLSANSPSLST